MSEPRKERRRDRAGKEQALIKAALHLFASKGFEATSTREIAASAGCAEGLIHRYFKGKAGLIPALIEHSTAEEITDLGQNLPPAATLEVEFLQLVEWEVEFMWKNRQYLQVFIPRAMMDAKLRPALSHAVLELRVNKVAERLKRYPASKKLNSSAIEAMAQSVGLLGLIFGFMRPVVLRQNRSTARQMALCIAKLMICGLKSSDA